MPKPLEFPSIDLTNAVIPSGFGKFIWRSMQGNLASK
jgi:hypothetical protein